MPRFRLPTLPMAASVRTQSRALAPLLIALICAISCALLPMLAQRAYAGTIAVDAGGCTLPEAIAVANSDVSANGCTIVGATGADTLNLSTGIHALTAIESVVNGNNGTPSIISGSIITITGHTNGSTIKRFGSDEFRLLYVAAGGKLTIQHVTLTNGDTSGSNSGGAIYAAGALTVTDSIILSNTAEFGGGLYALGNSAFISNTDFLSNTATTNGGAIAAAIVNPFNITNSLIQGNTGTSGGGVVNLGSKITLNGSEFFSNTATSGGGAIYTFSNGIITMTNSFVEHNRANFGGGVASNTATVTISNTDFISNTATNFGGGNHASNTALNVINSFVAQNRAINGGGFFVLGSTATFSNTDFVSNTATNGGGGLYTQSNGIITMTNSFVEKNQAITGGGLYATGSSAIISNTHFVSNTATANGGGLHISTNATLTLTNSHVEQNTGSTGGGLAVTGGTTTINNTDFVSNTATNSGGLHNTDNGHVTITGGSVKGNEATSEGGGISTTSATTVISDVTFINNFAFFGGGIAGGGSAEITVINSDILSHSIAGQGGGVFINGATITVTGSLIEGNSANIGGGLQIYNGAMALIKASTIRHNEATNHGGGIYNNTTAQLYLTDSEVITNVSGVVGGGIYNDGSAITLTNSSILSNTTVGGGGGIYNTGGSTLLFGGGTLATNSAVEGGGLFNNSSTARVDGATVRANRALAGNGGGIYNNSGTLLITDTLVTSNTTTGAGAGLYNTGNIITTGVINSEFATNAAGFLGGAIHNFNGMMEIIDSTLRANRTLNGPGGGGALANSGSALTLSGSTIISNSAVGNGGGVLSGDSTTIITGTHFDSNTATESGAGLYFIGQNSSIIATVVTSNRADEDGGGLYIEDHDTNISDSAITLNHAQGDGGGLYGIHSQAPDFASDITIHNSDITTNSSDGFGGGVMVAPGAALAATATRFLTNLAPSGGGAIFAQSNEDIEVTESCIVNNSDYALFYGRSTAPVATANWWGAPDGPAGEAPGSGDSISLGVIYTNFKTASILDCPFVTVDVALSKVVEPASNLLPGQPVTFTLTITNNDDRYLRNVVIGDPLPAAFQLTQVISSGALITEEIDGFQIGEMSAGSVATIQFLGTISATLSEDQALTNTATLTQAAVGQISATIVSNIDVPLLTWASNEFNANEEDGSAEAAVLLSPPNPYAAVNVQVVTTDTVNPLSIAAVQPVNIPAGSSSFSVTVPFDNDSGVGGRSIEMSLQNPQGAAVLAGNSATIIINDDDQAGLTVQKSANVTQAAAGDTIVYTYRITNTGTVTLTIAANDNRLGNVGELAGQLAPLATASAVMSYVVQPSDPLGALVNTVTVTGTDSLVTDVVVADSFTVNIVAAFQPTLALLVEKSASPTSAVAGDTVTYTYVITNTGNVTLTITASDDRLGSMGSLAGDLAPGAPRSATIPYVVQQSDPVSPLVNTVTVTGTFEAQSMVVSDTFSINIGSPTNLPEGEQPTQQGMQIFLPRLSNTEEE